MRNISERRLHSLISEIAEIPMFGFTIGAWGNVCFVVRPFAAFVCRFHPATCFQNPAKSG